MSSRPFSLAFCAGFVTLRPWNTFGTSAVAKRLEAVGFTKQQAETLADEQGKLIDERLAPKHDIGGVRAGIGSLRIEMGREMQRVAAETKAEILKWLFGTGALQTVVIIGALMGLLHGTGR